MPAPPPTRALAHPGPPRPAAVVAAALVGVGASLAPCPFAATFHAPCPTCGMTRAFLLLARGRFAASWQMHPLVVPALAAGILFVASVLRATLATRDPARFHAFPAGRAALVTGVVVYALCLVVWVARALGALGGPVPV